MYKDCPFPATILIVKTSSLGDIIQTFSVLEDLKSRFPSVAIDWAVEASFSSIVSVHPLVRRCISLDIKGKKNWWQGLKELRREPYDLIFDFQGNCKSGAITWLARGKVKVGYGRKTVREWPNVLATHVRFEVPKQQNIRQFYLGLIEGYFKTPSAKVLGGVRFAIEAKEREKVESVLHRFAPHCRIMACPGSKWTNKQLSRETWIGFLQKIEQAYGASFYLIWGEESEKAFCEGLAHSLKQALVVDRLPLPTWQNLMSEMDLILAVDSSALHLSGTTSTPSFSIFGPTSPTVFKPLGNRHFAIQGPCPYGRTFEKQCPILRTCSTGACIKGLSVEELFVTFQSRCVFLRRESPPRSSLCPLS